MRAIIVVSSMVFLVGCQSDFDRCMETELPRAEKTFGISQLESDLTRFRDASEGFILGMTHVTKYASLYQDVKEPESMPKYPEYPEFVCGDLTGKSWTDCYAEYTKKTEKYDKQKVQYDTDYEKWKQTPDAITWRRDQETRSVNVWNMIGVPGGSQAEIDTWFDERYPQDELGFVLNEVEEYAKDFDCWGEGTDSCFDPIGAQVRAELGPDYGDDEFATAYFEASKKVVTAVIGKMTENYVDAVSKAEELAKLTCNQNGFYE